MLAQAGSSDESGAVTALTGTVVGLLLVAAGAVVIVVARRAASGKIPRNRLAGIRTRATLASDQAWAAGHRAAEIESVRAGRTLQVTGAALVLIGLAAAVDAIAPNSAHLLIRTGALVGTAVMFFFVFRVLRSANAAARSALGHDQS